MTKKIPALLLAVVAALFFFYSFSFAAVNITGRSGEIKITSPKKTGVIFKMNQPLPEIPDGAVIQILSGTAQIAVEGDFSVQVNVSVASARLNSGSAVIAAFNPAKQEGSIRWVSGRVEIFYLRTITIMEPNNRNRIFYVNLGKIEDRVQTEEASKDISPSS